MSDTIVALSTPPGIGGIAVVRVSGAGAIAIADMIFSGKIRLKDAASHTIHYGKIIIDEMLIDTVTSSVFKSPNSYTGEDTIEISCHGGMIVAKEIISGLVQKGCRLAEKGEFTKRAFLNGKLDLSQVEAVADLIHSSSLPAVRTAARQLAGNFKSRLNDILTQLTEIAGLLELELDFAEEDIEFVDKFKMKQKIVEAADYCSRLHLSHHSAEILRNGYYVGIAGYPNSGKSTLFNTLLQKHRAIVSPTPGTTRDYIEESLYINDLHVRLIDTAGIRETEDQIELEGVRMVDSIIKQSDLILIINDITKGKNYSLPLASAIKEKYEEANIIIVQNKIDLLDNAEEIASSGISAKQNIGIENIKHIISEKANETLTTGEDILVNQRQSILLESADEILRKAAEALDSGADNVMIAIDIRQAASTLGEIVGASWNENVLNQIFSKFCIGK